MTRKRAISTAKRRSKAPARATKESQAKPSPRGAAARRDALDDFLDAASAALALPVAPEWKPAVKSNLEVTLRLAAAVADFPLPDEAEPAPVFVA
jgi:Protein of unknown function (DUF4089)